MSSAAKIALSVLDGPGKWAVAALGIVVAYFAFVKITEQAGSDAAGAIGQTLTGAGKAVAGAAGSVASTVGGLATGNNPLTDGTPYAGTGIFGTLGAVTNDILGGAPEAFGNWIGEKLSTSTNTSTTNQSTTGNPFAAGPSNSYAMAVNNSPPQASFPATPFATSPNSNSW